MTDRSNIDLLANATTGVNLGVGSCVFKCKNVTGNTLQFKTISVAGGLSIITGDTTLTISGKTGGNIVVPSGFTNYLLKATTTGVTISSIYDSGTTVTDNISINKYNILLGGNIADGCKVTIKPKFNRKIELIAQSGVNIGSYSGNCLCIGATPDGLTLCSASYCDLLLHAGSYTTSGQAGKTLKLSGGDGLSAAGGNVVLTGGTGSIGGNVVLSTSNSGRVQITNLPTSIQTNGIYIDGSGNLSKGFVGTGSTTIIGGTVNHIPVFNTLGNNIQNTTLQFTGCTLSNNNCLIVDVPDSNCIFLNAPNSTFGVCYGNIYLGKPTTSSVITGQRICAAGAATNIEMWLSSKGSGQMYLYSPTVNLSNSGTMGFGFTSASRLFQLPMNAKICGYPGGNGASYCDATPICILGGNGVTNLGWAGSGGTICINAGNAGDGIGGTPKIGGSLILKAGLGVSGGANGRVQICGLPTKTSETCGIFIDSNGKLSTGVISGGSGGGGGIAVTGATNGVCLYNSKNVCLGGNITSNVSLVPTGTNTFALGSASNNINVGTGRTIICNSTSPSLNIFCVDAGKSQRIGINLSSGYYESFTICPSLNCYSLIASNGGAVCNSIAGTYTGVTIGSTTSCIKNVANATCIYNMSTGTAMQVACVGATSIILSAFNLLNSTFQFICLDTVSNSTCMLSVNSNCSAALVATPNALTVFGCTNGGATFAGITYCADFSANYGLRTLIDKGYATTTFAPKANPTFTGTVTTPIIKITTGAAAGCVLTSAADGTASWATPSGGGGGINWNNTTANGIGVYVNATTICPHPSLTFTAGNFTVLGTVTATDYILGSDERLKTCVEAISIAPINIEYKQFNYICEPKQLRYGVIAQELQLVNPELVKVNSDGMLGVSYTDLLIKEVAYLKYEVNELRSIINEIKNKL